MRKSVGAGDPKRGGAGRRNSRDREPRDIPDHLLEGLLLFGRHPLPGPIPEPGSCPGDLRIEPRRQRLIGPVPSGSDAQEEERLGPGPAARDPCRERVQVGDVVGDLHRLPDTEAEVRERGDDVIALARRHGTPGGREREEASRLSRDDRVIEFNHRKFRPPNHLPGHAPGHALLGRREHCHVPGAVGGGERVREGEYPDGVEDRPPLPPGEVVGRDPPPDGVAVQHVVEDEACGVGEFDGTGKVERPAGGRLPAGEGRVDAEEEPGPHPLPPEEERDDAGVDRTPLSRHLRDPPVDGRSDALKELAKRYHGSLLPGGAPVHPVKVRGT